MATVPHLSYPKHPLPDDVRLKLPDPTTPWKIGDRIMGEMSAQASSPYQKVEVLPEDPEWNFIHAMFHHDKPIRWDMIGAYCIHEPHQTRSFELNLVTTDREADKFAPTWHGEPRAAQRAQVIDRWRKTTEPFSPFQTMESGGRSEPLTKVRVIPMWHGSSYEVCASIAETGFAFFGKKSIGKKAAGDPKSTDGGFFGSGIYFTNSARYAADIYSTGHMIMAWVSMREPFPVVGDAKQSDMQTLQGGGAYKHYNAHYIPVCPQKMSHLCAMYFPCKEGETPFCDEVVVFQKAQTLPRFWVVLEPSALHLMQPKFIKPQSGPALATALDKPFKTLEENFRPHYSNEVKDVAWSLDGKSIFVINTKKKTIDIWDVFRGKLLLSRPWVLKNSSAYPCLLRPIWSPDRTRFFASVQNKKTGIWASIRMFFEDKSTYTSDNYEFVCCVFNTETCEPLMTLKEDICAWSPDSKNILTRTYDKRVRSWDVGKGELLRTFKGHEKRVLSAQWSPDGKSVLSGSMDKTVRIWDAEKGELLKVLKGHEDQVWFVQWSSDGKKLLSRSKDKTVRIWDAVTELSLHTIEYPIQHDYIESPGFFSGVEWIPDSSYFLVPSVFLSSPSDWYGSSKIDIWDASSGTLLTTLDKGSSLLAPSPNGKYIAAKSLHVWKYGHLSRLSVWSVADGKLHLDFKAEVEEVKSIKWSPDSKYILTGSNKGAIRIWEVP